MSSGTTRGRLCHEAAVYHRTQSLIPTAMMDAVSQSLHLTYVPELASASATFKFICSSVEQCEVNKSQLEALTNSIKQLLQALDKEYRARRSLKDETLVTPADLSRFVTSQLREAEFNLQIRLLEDISDFVQREASSSFLKLLFAKNRKIIRIDGYYRRIGILIKSFQVWYITFYIRDCVTDRYRRIQLSPLLNISELQTRNNDARVVDERALNQQLLELETNHERLRDALSKFCR